MRIWLVALAALLVWAGTAQAHSGRWYYTHGAAERSILRVNASVGLPGGTVKCYGKGGSLAPRADGGSRFFKHFDCIATARDGARSIWVWHSVPRENYFMISNGARTFGPFSNVPIRGLTFVRSRAS